MVPKTKKSKITTFLARKKAVLRHHNEFGSDVTVTETVTKMETVNTHVNSDRS